MSVYGGVVAGEDVQQLMGQVQAGMTFAKLRLERAICTHMGRSGSGGRSRAEAQRSEVRGHLWSLCGSAHASSSLGSAVCINIFLFTS